MQFFAPTPLIQLPLKDIVNSETHATKAILLSTAHSVDSFLI